MEIDVKSCIGIDQWERLVILEHNKMKTSPTGLRPAFEAFLDGLEKNASTKDRPLEENEYRVFVDYGPNPSKVELERDEFSGDGSVSRLFDGRVWGKHPLCADINEANGERVMRVFHFDDPIIPLEAIARAEKEGYRPATEKEVRAFAKGHPALQHQFRIVALGSIIRDGGRLCVAVLAIIADRRALDTAWFHGWWDDANDRFLFVRK